MVVFGTVVLLLLPHSSAHETLTRVSLTLDVIQEQAADCPPALPQRTPILAPEDGKAYKVPASRSNNSLVLQLEIALNLGSKFLQNTAFIEAVEVFC